MTTAVLRARSFAAELYGVGDQAVVQSEGHSHHLLASEPRQWGSPPRRVYLPGIVNRHAQTVEAG
jgi:hypothetical protein